jgi:hypothetical protein
MGFSLVLIFFWGLALPGDGFEEAEADEEAEGCGEEDGPGVCGEAGEAAAAKGGHGEVSFGKARCTRKNVWVAAAMKFLERV